MNAPVVVAQGDVNSSSTAVGISHPRQQQLTRRGPGRLLRGLAACLLRHQRRQDHVQTPLTQHRPHHLQRPDFQKTPIKRRHVAQGPICEQPGCQGDATTALAAAAEVSSSSSDNFPEVSSSSSFPEVSSSSSSSSPHQQQLPVRQHTWLSALRRTVSRVLKGLGRAISPKGPGDNDASILERVLNVLTCIPFFIVGQSFLRRPPSAHFVRFGHAMKFVGVIASLYHASSGKARVVLRKLDYWSIACASALLRGAVVGQMPRTLVLGMSALVSLKPTFVTTANLVAVEARCLANVMSSGSSYLLVSWAQHAAVSLAAIVSFGLEGRLSATALGPFVHASWHCLAAGGMLTTGMLLRSACPLLEG